METSGLLDLVPQSSRCEKTFRDFFLGRNEVGGGPPRPLGTEPRYNDIKDGDTNIVGEGTHRQKEILRMFR